MLIAIALGLGVVLLTRAPVVEEGPGGRSSIELIVDPNTVTPEVLQAFPRIGPARASAIVEARGQGPFRSLWELQQRVRGIGPATASALAPHLRFGEEDVPAASARPRPRVSGPTSP